MPFWERIAIVGGVLLLAAIAAGLIDRKIARNGLQPGAVTRYRVLRRTVVTAVMLIGLLSALLVIPQVRAVAGGLLASSAVLAVVFGFAARQTLGNVIAGLMIAFTQPLRIGDRVEVGDAAGTVEEIRLSYTMIRTRDNARLAIPNEKLASDTIRNASIVDRAQLAEVSLKVPLTHDLEHVVEVLRGGVTDVQDVSVDDLDTDEATVSLRVRATDGEAAERLEPELRLQAYRALREAGVYA
jgi:small-conductance mechanosensitive channel